MPRNSSGTYTLPEAAFVAGTTIQSAPVNFDLSDIATALTQSVATTGVSSMTGPIKAASGSVTAPSITFGTALGTGFYLAGANQIGWTSNGVQAATFNSNLSTNWAGAASFASTLAVTGAFSVIGAATFTVLTAASTVTPIISQITTNNTSEHTLIGLVLGSGAGNVGSIRAVGTGANDVTTLRTYIGTTLLVNDTITAHSPKKNISLDAGITVIATAGYVELTEISDPAAPAADKLRIYTKDDGAGTTRAYIQDSAAAIGQLLIPATSAQQITATSNLVGVTPGRQHFNPMHPKGTAIFNGEGSITALTVTGNVTGIVRDSTGVYTASFSPAFTATATYGMLGWVRGNATQADLYLGAASADTKTTSAMQFRIRDASGGSNQDSAEIFVIFFGPLA